MTRCHRIRPITTVILQVHVLACFAPASAPAQEAASPIDAVLGRLAGEAGLLAARASSCQESAASEPCPCTGKLAKAAAKAFASAAGGFQKARELETQGNTAPALAKAASALATALKYEPCGADTLTVDLAAELLEAAEARVAGAHEDVEASGDSLCAAYRARVDKLLAKCEALEHRPDPEAGSSPDPMTRIKALSKALKCLVKVGKKARSYEGRTCKGACPGEPLTFTRGPDSAASIEVKPILRGTQVTYRVVLEDFVDLEGLLHYSFNSESSISVSGSLEACVSFSNCIGVDVSGSISTKTCGDVTGFRRFSSISESIKLKVEGQGSTSSSFTVTASPPTIAFVDGLLPLTPSGSVTLREGDQVEEADVVLHVEGSVGGRRGSGDLRITSVSHRVAAVEQVQVLAGIFKAARVESTVVAEEGLKATLTSWIAPSVGLVKAVQADEEGFPVVELELVRIQLPRR